MCQTLLYYITTDVYLNYASIALHIHGLLLYGSLDYLDEVDPARDVEVGVG